MRTLLLIVLACAGAEPPAATPLSDGEGVEEEMGSRSDIDVAGLKAKMDAGEIQLIDVRTPGEYAGGHVPGALSMPMGEFDASKLPQAEVYVICQSGGRSSRAANQMATEGYAAVNVEGGTAAWIAAGYATEP